MKGSRENGIAKHTPGTIVAITGAPPIELSRRLLPESSLYRPTSENFITGFTNERNRAGTVFLGYFRVT